MDPLPLFEPPFTRRSYKYFPLNKEQTQSKGFAKQVLYNVTPGKYNFLLEDCHIRLS